MQKLFLKVVRCVNCLSHHLTYIFLDDANSSSETPPPKSKVKGPKLQYENGYPKIPDPDKMKHKEMEVALRELMTHHYREGHISIILLGAHQ